MVIIFLLSFTGTEIMAPVRPYGYSQVGPGGTNGFCAQLCHHNLDFPGCNVTAPKQSMYL